MLSVSALLATIGVFIGCCSGVVFLELLIKYDAGIGNLITFAQFTFIAFEGFVITSRFGSAQRKIGLRDYAKLVIMFFLTSVCNNYAFNFNIPMPLHMIFRAGSLISNMFMGTLILKRRYNLRQYLSVIMISVGIFLCTYHSSEPTPHSNTNLSYFKYRWMLGIFLLAGALLVSSYMGICQEILYRRFGKHAREALYYTHLLPLPGFFLLHDDIRVQFGRLMTSETYSLTISKQFALEWSIPIAMLYLLGNVFTQYICISSVYKLTTECTSLTVTLILTLRKLLSLIFSILYFRNPFTIYHWLGTIMVFVGTLLFADIFTQIRQRIESFTNKNIKTD